MVFRPADSVYLRLALMRRLKLLAFVTTLLAVSGCDQPKQPEQPKQSDQSTEITPSPSPSPTLAVAPSPTATPTVRPTRPENLWNRFDAQRALVTAQKLLRFGPRIAGTVGDTEARSFLLNELEQSGWSVTEQTFTVPQGEGPPLTLANLAAESRVRPLAPPKFLVLAHFDTLRSNVFTDPGATDGAANAAVLIELARTLSLDPQLAACTRLFLLDGHYPLHQLTANDGLYGSRALLAKLQHDENLKTVQAVISIENVGAQGPLDLGADTDSELSKRLEAAAKILEFKLQSAPRPLWGDQTPFVEAGLPAVALLESNAPFLGTADDDAAKLTEPALANIGRIVVCFLSSYDLSSQ
jgi:hypothetical protein